MGPRLRVRGRSRGFFVNSGASCSRDKGELASSAAARGGSRGSTTIALNMSFGWLAFYFQYIFCFYEFCCFCDRRLYQPNRHSFLYHRSSDVASSPNHSKIRIDSGVYLRVF